MLAWLLFVALILCTHSSDLLFFSSFHWSCLILLFLLIDCGPLSSCFLQTLFIKMFFFFLILKTDTYFLFIYYILYLINPINRAIRSGYKPDLFIKMLMEIKEENGCLGTRSITNFIYLQSNQSIHGLTWLLMTWWYLTILNHSWYIIISLLSILSLSVTY